VEGIDVLVSVLFPSLPDPQPNPKNIDKNMKNKNNDDN
jgi:hypothetical protein